jgi:hypothetical protein
MNADEYTIGNIVDSTNVPNWARREPKWGALIESINQVKPGDSLTVIFSNLDVANRARNTVRDTINMSLGRAAIRTRVVSTPEGKCTVYFTRLADEDIVEAVRK